MQSTYNGAEHEAIRGEKEKLSAEAIDIVNGKSDAISPHFDNLMTATKVRILFIHESHQNGGMVRLNEQETKLYSLILESGIVERLLTNTLTRSEREKIRGMAGIKPLPSKRKKKFNLAQKDKNLELVSGVPQNNAWKLHDASEEHPDLNVGEDVVEVTPSITAEKARELLATLGEVRHGDVPKEFFSGFNGMERSAYLYQGFITFTDESSDIQRVRSGRGKDDDKATIDLFGKLTEKSGIIGILRGGDALSKKEYYLWNGENFVPTIVQTELALED